MTRRLLVAGPLALLFALFVVSGFRGVDFGYHWDEHAWHVDPVRIMVTNGVLLPRNYFYPSFGEWLVMLPSLKGALSAALESGGAPRVVQATMKAILDDPGYLMTARYTFILVSALSLVWIYGAVLALRRTWWEALIAAACLGLSWEFAYHARWVTDDCILAQFGALALFMLALFHRLKRPIWLTLSAVAVGLATGTKQQGLFLLLPVFVAIAVSRPWDGPRRKAAQFVAVAAISFAVFVATTPGFLLDPFAFLRDTRSLTTIYAAGRGGYTVTGMAQHWRIVLEYLGVVFFSPFKPIAMLMFAATLVGGYAWVRRDWRFGVVVVSFPLGFLLFFCAKYVVMIARNYLVIAPFLGVLAARGVAEVVETLQRLNQRWAVRALAAGLVVVAVVQGAWLVRAGESIRHVDANTYVREAVAYVAEHPGTQFRVSERVRALATAQHLPMPPNVAAAPGGDAVVMFGRADNGPLDSLRINDPWLTDAVFGPREVNYDWYATWAGHDRIVVMKLETARAGGAPVAR